MKAMQSVELSPGISLFDSEELPRYVYFLETGIASVVFTSKAGATVEVATLGDEGMVGWIFLLGPHPTPMECTVQVEATACRLPLNVALREFQESAEFRKLVLEFAQHQAVLANQLVACNRLHLAEARLARWLLTVQDRSHVDELRMTQEFLSTMLGTRRTTVVEVAAALERVGAIEHRRGRVRIVSRPKLEGAACECYPRLQKLLGDLYKL